MGNGELTFNRAKFKDVINEVLPLAYMHWQESEDFKQDEFKLDVNKYSRLEDEGFFHGFVAKLDDQIIGYAGFVINSSMHDEDSLRAYSESIFIHPEHRGIGHKFIKFLDEEMSKIDFINAVMFAAKPQKDFGYILEPMGYKKTEIVYGRDLNG